MNEKIIEFVMHVTGHDRETVIQLFNDFDKFYKPKC